jgi:hypothetical protein
MSEDLRSITTKNLPDAIRLLNETSQDTSVPYNIDFFGFLSIRRFWNFALSYSLIRYIDNQPAAIAINCADPKSREAYTFYWGTHPRFRRADISINLVEAFCQKFHDDGYTRIYANSSPDRPVRRYRFTHFFPLHALVDMNGDCSRLPAADPAFTIRRIDVSVLAQILSSTGEPFHWVQRPSFLADLGPIVELLGAFSGEDLKAYAVVPAKRTETVLFDLRSPESCFPAGYELLRYLARNYPSPVMAQQVFEGSFAERLLTEAGFLATRKYFLIHRDLRTSCAQPQAS